MGDHETPATGQHAHEKHTDEKHTHEKHPNEKGKRDMTELMIRCTAASTPEVALLATAWLGLRARLDAALDDQRGMTTETVIITAGLAALAVAVVAIIASRVRNRARAIP